MAVDSTRRSATSTWLGASLKTLSLTTLIIQNSILILIMHYSRIMPLVDGHRYLPSTAVLISEIMKFSISFTMALYDIAARQPNAPATTLFGDLFAAIFSGDGWKLAIPAMLYTLQNSLQYLAVSNLNASTFQITYQLKILTTAVFSVVLLGRTLSGRKWLSLLVLALGVAIVQLPGSTMSEDWDALLDGAQLNYWFPKSLFPRREESWKAMGRRAWKSIVKRSATYQGIDEDFALHYPHHNRVLGLLAVVVACLSSGLAGVYFEKVLKEHSSRASRSGARTHISVWVRNVQLSFYSLFPALFIGVIFKDGGTISRHGFWAGYNKIVWLTIVLQAFGGVVVALVINYSNNIAKNFATSISIVISFIASIFFFDLAVTFEYLLGTCIVVAATWMYNAPERARGPTVVVEDYEKQEAPRPEPGYYDLLGADLSIPSGASTPLRGDIAYSTSRPGSPSGERHFRVPAARRNQDKRDA